MKRKDFLADDSWVVTAKTETWTVDGHTLSWARPAHPNRLASEEHDSSVLTNRRERVWSEDRCGSFAEGLWEEEMDQRPEAVVRDTPTECRAADASVLSGRSSPSFDNRATFGLQHSSFPRAGVRESCRKSSDESPEVERLSAASSIITSTGQLGEFSGAKRLAWLLAGSIREITREIREG